MGDVANWFRKHYPHEYERELELAKNTVSTQKVSVQQPSAITTQVGGSHYKALAIQPLEYMIRNNMGAAEGKVLKYISRWKDKGGVEDLKKARHVIDFLIEMVEKYPEIAEK